MAQHSPCHRMYCVFHADLKPFQLISKLIYQRAGISLSESKQELVYSRVARRLRATISMAV